MYRTLLSTTLIALLAACAAERAPAEADPQPAQAGQTAADAAPIDDQPAQDVPPATAPATPAPDAGTAPGPDGDRGMARFDGYGDIRFGTAADDMESAWGGELKVDGKEYNERCYYMVPKWAKTQAGFNFMIGDGKFARFGTDDAKFVAPGGGKIGMTKAEITGLYGAISAVEPHKYTDGEYLRIKDPAGGNGVLIFETDGKADTAKVTEWRVGTEPHVGFVEGCA